MEIIGSDKSAVNNYPTRSLVNIQISLSHEDWAVHARGARQHWGATPNSHESKQGLPCRGDRMCMSCVLLKQLAWGINCPRNTSVFWLVRRTLK